MFRHTIQNITDSGFRKIHTNMGLSFGFLMNDKPLVTLNGLCKQNILKMIILLPRSVEIKPPYITNTFNCV